MRRIVSRLAVIAVVAVSLMTFSARAAEGTGGASAALLVAGSELKWTDVAGFPGVKMAVVHGDPSLGAAHFFIKLPAGFTSGMHFHNADHYVAVVSGTLSLTPESGAEKRLPAGSAFAFTGKKKHGTKCAEGADCVLFVDARGKWDVIPVEQK